MVYYGCMPELPEVETIRIGLESLIVHRAVRAVMHDTDKSFPNPPAEVKRFLIGATVVAVRRRAKVLMIDLSSAYTLVIHLKMTGQLVFVAPMQPSSSQPAVQRGRFSNKKSAAVVSGDVKWSPNQVGNYENSDTSPAAVISTDSLYSEGENFLKKDSSAAPQNDKTEDRFGAGHPSDSLIGELPDKSTRVTIAFEDGSHLYFNDQRKFGWMRLMPTVMVPEIDFMKKVGPEPLEDSFTGKVLFERLQRRKNTTIKAAILDQTVLAGVGNIYADESLWGAKIHPATLVKDISNAKIGLLTNEIKYVMNLSIEKGGSTDKNYVNAEGKRGSYIDFARVFRREGEPCPRCGTTIIKIRVAGRGTHLCPHCQTTKL